MTQILVLKRARIFFFFETGAKALPQAIKSSGTCQEMLGACPHFYEDWQMCQHSNTHGPNSLFLSSSGIALWGVAEVVAVLSKVFLSQKRAEFYTIAN
jgi:hypothetical protein